MYGFFKDKGAKVSCEVNPYHLLFNELELLTSYAKAKVNPPLRGENQRKALLKALKDGTIDCIATDHAPHASWEKGAYIPIVYMPVGDPIILTVVHHKASQLCGKS